MKNSFVLLADPSQVLGRFCFAKELLICRMIGPDSASTEMFAFIQFMKCLNSLASLYGTLLAYVFVGTQKMSKTTHDFHRHRRERGPYRLSASDLAWGRSAAFKGSSVSSALAMEFNHSLKCCTGLNKDSI